MKKEEQSIFLKIIEYGIKFPKGFTYTQFTDGFKLDSWEIKIVNGYVEAAFLNAETSPRGNFETPFFLVEKGNSSYFGAPLHKYIISYDANFKYIDYQELKFARQTSKEAKILSIIAIIISLGAVIASILMPIKIANDYTQTIKLDSSQLELIQQSINETIK